MGKLRGYQEKEREDTKSPTRLKPVLLLPVVVEFRAICEPDCERTLGGIEPLGLLIRRSSVGNSGMFGGDSVPMDTYMHEIGMHSEKRQKTHEMQTPVDAGTMTDESMLSNHEKNR